MFIADSALTNKGSHPSLLVLRTEKLLPNVVREILVEVGLGLVIVLHPVPGFPGTSVKNSW